MKFLCVGYYNAEKMDAKSMEEIDTIMSECGPHLDTFYKTDKVLLDVGVEQGAKQLRRSGGHVKVIDPQAGAEKIGSVFIIEAETIEEAIQVAALHPSVQVEAGEEFGWRLEIHRVHSYRGVNGC
ncbi:YciI family protein [Bacillus sp. MCCB 382]|uniref:YciI family protein n=1 Tax=Bacillus sp. MCCB 382 TaxID=2860197 RepID=UPI001C57BC38|nr:YciI family protein [Bacillus sp. MCCB 382]